MSIYKQHDVMSQAFQESKDIINQIFDAMKAPRDWQIIHMTFEELVAALYKILGLYTGEFREDVTVTPDTLLRDITAFNSDLEVVIGNIERIAEAIYTPTTENQLIIESKKYTDGNQYIAGDPCLVPENIKKGVTIFDVEGTLEPSTSSDEPVNPDPDDPNPDDPNPDDPDEDKPDKETATNQDILKGTFAYTNELEKIIGDLRNCIGKTRDGNAKRVDNEEENLYVSPTERAAFDQTSELEIHYEDIAELLDIDPSKILRGYKILGVEGTHLCPDDENKDTDDDGEPDINIPPDPEILDPETGEPPWVHPELVDPKDKDKKSRLNDDTDGDGKPDINIDTDNDGLPDVDVDTDKDGKPDVNVDLDKDGIPDINIDRDWPRDYYPDDEVENNWPNESRKRGKKRRPVKPKDPEDEDRNKFDDEKERERIQQDPIDPHPVNPDDVHPDPIKYEDDEDEDRNPDLSDPDDIEDLMDDDYKPILEVEDEEGKKHYVPNPVLQWEYSDYYLPMIYPTAQLRRYEDYAVPYDLTKDRVRYEYGDLHSIAGLYTADVPLYKAMQLAARRGEILVMIKNQNDQNVVEQNIRDYNATGAFWTSGHCWTSWQWEDGTPMNYTNWSEGEPNNVGNVTESGLTVYGVDGQNWQGQPYHWNDENPSRTDQMGYITEKKDMSNRTRHEIHETDVIGKQEDIVSDEVNAAMAPFVRYGIVQEERSKLYHYGNNTYLNLSKLSENVDSKIPLLKSRLGHMTSFIPGYDNGFFKDYMTYWPNETTGTLKDPITPEMLDAHREEVYNREDLDDDEKWEEYFVLQRQIRTNDEAYDRKQSSNNNGEMYVEKPDKEMFNQENYIEKAKQLYERIGLAFKYNGEVNSFTYKDPDTGIKFKESPKAEIYGESFLQVYCKDLKIDPRWMGTIWRSAYYDYQDYLPKWYWPSLTETTVTETEYETRTRTKTGTRRITKIESINMIETVNSDFIGDENTPKDIMEFTVSKNDPNHIGNFTVTMNTGHWFGFAMLEKRNNQWVEVFNGHIPRDADPSIDQFANHLSQPLSMTAENIHLKPGHTYKIQTWECDGGGKEASNFVYTFDIEDSSHEPLEIDIQRIETETFEYEEEYQEPVTRERTVIDHIYMGYYPEDLRQEYFEDIKNTFEDLVKCVHDNVGIDYNEHNVGNIYQRGSGYSIEEKIKIAKCIHDYLVMNNAYEKKSEFNQSLYGSMSRIPGKGPVCTSYAMGFKYCCCKFGIVCQLAQGDTGVEEHGLHMWNRINYSPLTFTEKQYLHHEGRVNPLETSMVNVMDHVIRTYDNEHYNNYLSNGRLFFTDPNFDGNDRTVHYIESCGQYDAENWGEVDVCWDDPIVEGGGSAIGWNFFNVDSDFMHTNDGGNRGYSKLFMTQMCLECYANYVGQSSHQDQNISKMNSGNRYYGGNLYSW